MASPSCSQANDLIGVAAPQYLDDTSWVDDGGVRTLLEQRINAESEQPTGDDGAAAIAEACDEARNR